MDKKLDVMYFHSNRPKTPEEIEKEQKLYHYNIMMEKERRRVIKREKTNERLLTIAVAAAVFTTIAALFAYAYKKEDENFSKNAFTEKDAPYNVNITDQDILEAEQYYEELTNGKQR